MHILSEEAGRQVGAGFCPLCVLALTTVVLGSAGVIYAITEPSPEAVVLEVSPPVKTKLSFANIEAII